MADTRQTWLRRLAPLLLLVAALIAFRLVGPALPHDHEVVYELGSLAPEVTRLEVAWYEPDRPSEAPALASTWNFSAGKAPRRLPSTVRLHSGEWKVEARLELVPPAMGEPIEKRVRLGEGTTIIRLDGSRRE